MSDTAEDAPQIVQVLMHEVLLDDFLAWLASRGLELQRTPFLDEGDLPVYTVTPGEALWRLAQQEVNDE